MKLADAEELLRVVKLDGPILEPWSCLTDEGILLEAWPAGYAKGSVTLDEFGQAIEAAMHLVGTGGNLTSGHWARPRLAHGSRYRPFDLWQQEMYVYLRERQVAVEMALAGYHTAPLRPRTYEEPKLPKGGKRTSWRYLRNVPYDAIVRELEKHYSGEELERAKVSPGLLMTFANRLTTEPAIGWIYQGRPNVPKAELDLVKEEFCELLERFALNEEKSNAQGTVV